VTLVKKPMEYGGCAERIKVQMGQFAFGGGEK